MLHKFAAVFLLCFAAVAAAEDSLEIIPVNYRTAEELLPLLAPLLDPDDRIAADGANLIVRAPYERLERIKALVAQLDAKPHNLLITVLQSRDVTAEQLNANADVAVRVPINQPASASGEIYGEFNASRRRETGDDTQTIRTLEGQAAFIRAGTVQPLPTVTVSGPGYSTVNSTAMVDATSGFAVTPRLSGDAVILAVSPWSNRINAAGGIETQSATTNVSAKLGEWVELGGIDAQSQNSSQGLLSSGGGSASSLLRILVKVELID